MRVSSDEQDEDISTGCRGHGPLTPFDRRMTLQIEIFEGGVRNVIAAKYASCATVPSFVRVPPRKGGHNLLHMTRLKKRPLTRL